MILITRQFVLEGTHRFGEIYFYFRCRCDGKETTLAIISVYSQPNPILLTESHGSYASCQYFGDDNLVAVDVRCIESVIAMVPHSPPYSNDHEHHFFLVERPGLDIINLGSNLQCMTADV